MAYIPIPIPSDGSDAPDAVQLQRKKHEKLSGIEAPETTKLRMKPVVTKIGVDELGNPLLPPDPNIPILEEPDVDLEPVQTAPFQPLPMVGGSAKPADVLEQLLARTSAEYLLTELAARLPSPHKITALLQNWNIEIEAMTCHVDELQFVYVADKRKNKVMPNQVGEDYTLSYLGKSYDLKLVGCTFFPTTTSPFVIVSFIRLKPGN